MKKLSIRQWLFVGIAVFLASAALFYHLAGLFDQGLMQPVRQRQAQQQNSVLDKALNAATSSPDNWHDQAWQASFRDQLAGLGVQALILDPSGNQIFRAGTIPPGNDPARQAVVLAGDRKLGTVDLFVQQGGDPLPPIAAALSVLIALLFVRWQIGRYVVRPLEAMSVAARRIANGNLDFELPESRVREVADVGEAFEAMGEGLRGSIERQAQLEDERRFFIGAIAHDLRTPLFSLRGYLEGLEQGLAASPQKAARYIAVCRQKADQLDRLVSDLFAYTRAEYLQQTLECRPFDMSTLLQRAVEGAGQRAHDKGVELEVDVKGPDEACVVEGDEPLLERAVENLLDNALRYTPAGGKIAVALHRDEAGGRAQLTVTDTGPGIAPVDLPHLFDPLYRGEASRSRQTGGAGLGLAIARRALVAHGGDLTAANRKQGGAEFTGWLPLYSPQAQGPSHTARTSEKVPTALGT